MPKLSSRFHYLTRRNATATRALVAAPYDAGDASLEDLLAEEDESFTHVDEVDVVDVASLDDPFKASIEAMFPRWSLMRMKTPFCLIRLRTIRKGKAGLVFMVGIRRERIRFGRGANLAHELHGCTGALDTTVDPRATLEAYPTLIQEGKCDP